MLIIDTDDKLGGVKCPFAKVDRGRNVGGDADREKTTVPLAARPRRTTCAVRALKVAAVVASFAFRRLFSKFMNSFSFSCSRELRLSLSLCVLLRSCCTYLSCGDEMRLKRGCKLTPFSTYKHIVIETYLVLGFFKVIAGFFKFLFLFLPPGSDFSMA